MLIDFKLGATALVLRVVILDATVATGAGKTGLSSTTSGLNISALASNEGTATTYTAASSTINGIVSLGVYANPTSGHCRFQEVDATNLPGLYELQLENSRYAVTGAQALVIFITGATGAAPCRVCIPLRTVDPYSTNFGITTAVPANVTAIDGNATAGNNATLNLKQLNIVNPAGDAIVASATGANGRGIFASGNGTGDGIRTNGGTSGGSGINASGGATNSYGIIATGAGSGAGIRASGGATGQGIYFVGGTTSGQGILVTTTSGDGIAVTPTAGHGLNLAANGTSKHGLFATGGTAGTSDGIHATAGTGGVDVRGNVTIGAYASGQDPATLVLDVTASTHNTAGTIGAAINGAAAPTAAQVAGAVWDQTTTGHTTSGTFGAVMTAAGSAGDPWATTLPGSYAAGTAGNILGNNLKADVQTIKGQTVTCSAGVTIAAFVGAAGAPGANNGLPILPATGSKPLSVNVTNINGNASAVTLDTAGRLLVNVIGTATDLALTNSATRFLYLQSPNDGASLNDGVPLPDQTGQDTSHMLLSASANTSNVRPGSIITMLSGTQSGKARHITGLSGPTGAKVGSLNNAWSTSPVAGDTFRIDLPPKVNVGGFNLLQSPDYYVLQNPGFPLANSTDGAGNVSLAAAGWANVWTAAGAPTIAGGVVQANVVQVLGTNATTEEFPTAAVIATAVWGDTTDFTSPTTGSAAAKLNAAGNAGDPWATSLPGSYTGTQAGAIVGANLDARVSTRSAPATPQTIDTTTVLAYRDQRTGTAHTSPTIMDALTAAHFGSWGTAVDNDDGTTSALAPDGTTVVFVYPADPPVQAKLTSDGLDGVVVETGINARQALSPILAAAAGTLSGAGTGTITIKGANVATTRITATVDPDTGDRTAIALTLPT